MNKERFEELSEALRQAKAVRRGETAPSRVWSVTRGSNGHLHRRQLDPKEYQRGQQAEWENKIVATPTGAARVLLRVAARHPEVVLEEAMA
jgi:hypothetical protein